MHWQAGDQQVDVGNLHGVECAVKQSSKFRSLNVIRMQDRNIPEECGIGADLVRMPIHPDLCRQSLAVNVDAFPM